jgi:hypothetical protein
MRRLCAGVFAVLVLALLPGAPQPAAAATVDFGTLSIGDLRVLGNPPYAGSGSDQLLDTYEFQVSAPASLGADAIALNAGSLNFKGLTATLIEGTDINCIVCNVLATAVGDPDPLGPHLHLVYAGLAPATQYFIRILGSFGTSGTGAYVGLLAIVPIPPALLLFGTAIAGALAFARRRTTKPAAA